MLILLDQPENKFGRQQQLVDHQYTRPKTQIFIKHKKYDRLDNILGKEN